MRDEALRECTSLVGSSNREAGVTASAVGAAVCLPLMKAIVAWREGNCHECVEHLLAVSRCVTSKCDAICDARELLGFQSWLGGCGG